MKISLQTLMTLGMMDKKITIGIMETGEMEISHGTQAAIRTAIQEAQMIM